jgi:catalase
MVLELGKEYPLAGEDKLIDILLASLSQDLDDKGQPMLRQQHPKSHGLVKGEFIVDSNLPEDLKIGVFQREKYDVLIRFSNGSNKRKDGHLQSDMVGDARGIAIKLLNVGQNNNEQDFVGINHPVMFIKDIKGYLDFGLVQKGMVEGKVILKPGEPPQVDDEFREPFQASAYAFGILKEIAAKATTSPLDIIYWSTTPYKLGEKAIKYQMVPHQTQTFNPQNAQDQDNYLREGIKQYLQKREAYFDFKIQFQTDADKMLIEDPTIEWKESDSPFIKVATIKIFQQEFDTAEVKQQDESLSFSPWHCLPEHRPLGGVNRARNKIYTQLSEKRKLDSH